MEVRSNHARQCPPGQKHASQVVSHDVDGNHFFNRSVDVDSSRFSAGCMVFHPVHNHWHFDAAARFTLFRPDRRQVILVRARKMSFCLRDSERVPEAFETFSQPQHYDACARDLPQGISPGWVDVYSSYLVGQAMTLPPHLRDGVYCLGVRVDPLNELRESDETDNTSVHGFRLRGSHVGAVQSHPCR